MNDSKIIATKIKNTIGEIERIEYEWQGKSPITEVSWEFATEFYLVAEDGIFSIGPYRLRSIDFDPMTREFTCVRVDYPFWRVVVGWHRINRMLDIAYRRCIITLAVWGLASYSRGCIPSWRDIKLVQWIKKVIA